MNASTPTNTNTMTATSGCDFVAGMVVRATVIFAACMDTAKRFVRDHAFISENEHSKNSGLMMAIRTGG